METGSQEEWRWVVDYEGLYSVSNLGRVYSFIVRGTARWIPVPVYQRDRGNEYRKYKSVRLLKNGVSKDLLVHILVLRAFVGSKPDGLIGLHKDDDTTNNSVDNLKWGTEEENRLAGYSKLVKSLRLKIAKLDSRQVEDIKTLSNSGLSSKFLARQYGVCTNTISKILSGRSWR